MATFVITYVGGSGEAMLGAEQEMRVERCRNDRTS